MARNKVRIKDVQHVKKELKSWIASYYPELYFKTWKCGTSSQFETTEFNNTKDAQHLRRGYLGLNREQLHRYIVGICDALEILSYDREPRRKGDN